MIVKVATMNNNKDKNKHHSDENAKNTAWKTPMELPSVKPEDYDTSIDSANGSAGLMHPEKAKRTP